MNQKGSVLILTVIAVLILSVLAAGLLTVGRTETISTQNYQLKKKAYYEAVRGLEEIRDTYIHKKINLGSIKLWPDDTLREGEYGLKYSYITGTLIDLEGIKTYGYAEPSGIIDSGINAPPPTAMSQSLEVGDEYSEGMGGRATIYLVPVTSEVNYARTSAYTEIVAGIYGFEETTEPPSGN